MSEIKSFIDKETFKTLAGCVMFVEACTECVKLLMDDVNGAWVALFFAVIVSVVKCIFAEDYGKEEIVLAMINIVPIFLGSVGIYEVALKPLSTLLFS